MTTQSDTPNIETLQMGEVWLANVPSMGLVVIGDSKEHAIEGCMEVIREKRFGIRD